MNFQTYNIWHLGEWVGIRETLQHYIGTLAH